MAQLQQIGYLENNQLIAASQMLARSFHNDPLMTYLLPEAAKRSVPLAAFFEVCLRYGKISGEIYSPPNVEGAAIWINPGSPSLSLIRAIRAGLLASTLRGVIKLGPSAFGRLLNLDSYTGKVHKQVIPEAHYYLMVLGVDPASQGQGLGVSLVRPVLEKADTAGLPCYLETTNPKNPAFYQKLGFRVVDEGLIPKGGPYAWAMRREPVK